MTRFKKELIKRGIEIEETLPFLPYGNVEAIRVHSDTCVIATYDNRIGWWFREYNRQMVVNYEWDEDDYNEDGTINKHLVKWYY